MYGVLREIMKDDFVKERQEGRQEGWQEGRQEGQLDMMNSVAERMISAGKPGDEISLFTTLKRQDIDRIALRMNRTVSWNEARA